MFSGSLIISTVTETLITETLHFLKINEKREEYDFGKLFALVL